jgi:hypothetical protein
MNIIKKNYGRQRVKVAKKHEKRVWSRMYFVYSIMYNI